MFNCFFPDEYLDSTYVINFDDLYAQGYRGLLFDIDNTLVPHGAPADERACALFAHLKELGFKCCFLSNNQYERVSSFNDAIGAQFIENAHKPSTKSDFPPAFCQIIRNRVWRCLIRRYRLLISIMLTSLQSRIMRRQ